jgi:SPP1 family predicted phage head-tail adaptor
VRAGQLRHRIAIERSDAVTQDTLGEINPSWVTHKRLWAEVKELSGRELEYARQKTPNGTHAVRIRYTKNVTADMRIRHQGRILNIENVSDDSDIHREMVLTCSEAK